MPTVIIMFACSYILPQTITVSFDLRKAELNQTDLSLNLSLWKYNEISIQAMLTKSDILD